jgi:hypothetical protein
VGKGVDGPAPKLAGEQAAKLRVIAKIVCAALQKCQSLPPIAENEEE